MVPKIPPKSINNFASLSELFMRRFIVSRRLEKGQDNLMSIKKGKEETLKDYISRFRSEISRVTDCDDHLISIALTIKLKPKNFQEYLTLERPRSLTELLDRAQAYITLEETRKAERVQGEEAS